MSKLKKKTDISDLEDTFLECPICMEHFNQTDKRPHLLHSCLHAFCTQCLQKLVLEEVKGQIKCPLCRRVQKVPKKIETLPLGPVRSKLVDYKHKQRVRYNESRAEASFRYTVENISKLKDTALSPPCMIRNLPWKIMVVPPNPAFEKRHKFLGFFLQCNADTDLSAWYCYAVAEMKVISQRTEGKAKTRKLHGFFCGTQNAIGYIWFINWAELLNPDNGYVKDDMVTLEVYVSADVPHEVIGDRQFKAHKPYMIVQVLLEDSFYGHQGNDLFDVEKVMIRNFTVKKNATLKELLDLLAENLKYPVKHIRPWPFHSRQNKTFRPTILDIDADIHKPIHEIADYRNPWYVFVETLSPGSVLKELPPFDLNNDVLLFLKLYDPWTNSISYCGHMRVPISIKGVQLVPVLNRIAGFPPSTSLTILEEVNPNLLERLENLNQPIDKLIEELHDGDILVFHRGQPNLNILLFATYSYRDGPGQPVRIHTKHWQPYQEALQLSIKINELENKRQFKCIWVSCDLKEERELVLYPNKNGKVLDLLDEVKKQVDTSDHSTGHFSYKIFAVKKKDIPLDCLIATGTYRMEEIPKEDASIADDELLLPVAHFHKEVSSRFGVPFLLKTKHNEAFSSMKDRIRKKLDISEKEFDKYRFAIVLMGRQEYISEDEEKVNLSQFIPRALSLPGDGIQVRPWLGLDHVNKTTKKPSRSTTDENRSGL